MLYTNDYNEAFGHLNACLDILDRLHESKQFPI